MLGALCNISKNPGDLNECSIRATQALAQRTAAATSNPKARGNVLRCGSQAGLRESLSWLSVMHALHAQVLSFLAGGPLLHKDLPQLLQEGCACCVVLVLAHQLHLQSAGRSTSVCGQVAAAAAHTVIWHCVRVSL